MKTYKVIVSEAQLSWEELTCYIEADSEEIARSKALSGHYNTDHPKFSVYSDSCEPLTHNDIIEFTSGKNKLCTVGSIVETESAKETELKKLKDKLLAAEIEASAMRKLIKQTEEKL